MIDDDKYLLLIRQEAKIFAFKFISFGFCSWPKQGISLKCRAFKRRFFNVIVLLQAIHEIVFMLQKIITFNELFFRKILVEKQPLKNLTYVNMAYTVNW